MSAIRKAISGDVEGDLPEIAYTSEGVATVALVPCGASRAVVMLQVKEPKAHRVVSLVKYAIEKHPHDRLEAYVIKDDLQAAKLVTLCGFEWEGTMRRFHEGNDYDLYSRIA
jgi:hypothetical protein